MSDYCSICIERMNSITTWGSLFAKNTPVLCSKCEEQLGIIEGERCTICSRALKNLDGSYHGNSICLDCQRWEESLQWNSILQKNTSIYEYNPFLKETLARYKYRGDYAIAKAFANPIKEVLGKLDPPDIIVPIPLSKERIYERAFNQTTSILLEAQIHYTEILTRTHTEKQSKKSRTQRIKQEQVFNLNPKHSDIIQNKSILLFDDIYTTGMTLRQAALPILSGGAKSVSSLTIARG